MSSTEDDGAGLSSAVFILQSKSTSLNEKLQALRFLKEYVETGENLDFYHKKKINQLVTENVMKILLNVDKVAGARYRQLVRAEMLVLLATLLNSNGVFGTVLNNKSTGNDQMDDDDDDENNHFSSGKSDSKYDLSVAASPNEKARRITIKDDIITRPSSIYQKSVASVMLSRTTSPTGTVIRKPPTTVGKMITSASMELPLLRPVMEKKPQKHLRSWKLKPRPSILHNEQLGSDRFVPGTDPLNFFEQDRKLGYQKSRLWFPMPKAGVNPNLLPPDRLSGVVPQHTYTSDSERIAQEYLQMRAVASYMGDLVVPMDPSWKGKSNTDKRKLLLTQQQSINKTDGDPGRTTRFSGFTDPNRFHEALQETLDVWTPWLGLHLPKPKKGKKRPLPTSVYAQDVAQRPSKYPRNSLSSSRRHRRLVDSEAAGEALNVYNGEALPRMRTESDWSMYSGETKSFANVETPVGSVGPPSNVSIMQLLRERLGLDVWSTGEVDTGLYSEQIQQESLQLLDAQKRVIDASVEAARRKVHSIMDKQYAMFQPNYLLLLEGKEADSRKLLINMFLLFCRTKRKNILTLAFGTWKISLVLKASQERRPQYSKAAACYLIASWYTEARDKRIAMWIARWRERTGWLILNQRCEAIIPVQTLYRRWRDRRKLVAMHKAGPYLGVLSDIKLAPARPRSSVPFFVPEVIRKERRMYWLAATLVQAIFRQWSDSREYRIKRKKLLLLQSICRMWPVYMRFRRLKVITIKCQAWARRTIQARKYRRMKWATITLQKYVRRFLAILSKWRKLHRIWRAEEVRLAAAIVIQCRWRIFAAKKRTAEKAFMVRLREFSALVIQRNWYLHKQSFHTFFLMCALRIREVEDMKLERLATNMGRFQAARRIQRLYHARYQKRFFSALMKVQCWIRGRLGYILVEVLRRRKWATRKLRHWARVRVRVRHRLARRIQRWWWGLKKRRLLHHLWFRARLQEEERDREREEQCFWAAARIQAHVKGIWDRRWVRRHRAALKIQKNAKFFFGIKRWRNWKRNKIRKAVRLIVDRWMEKGVRIQCANLIALHSIMLRKPQALARGFLVRSLMRRARDYAFKLGLAVVRIQRFWRASGAMARAVEEMMALRRREENPFKDTEVIHDVLMLSRKKSCSYYNSGDPRVGMRVATMLHRLGLAEMVDMFPKKDFLFVPDLQTLKMEEMVQLYQAWQAKKERALKAEQKKNQHKQEGNEREHHKKKTIVPTQILQQILDIANPPLFSSNPVHVEKINQVLALPEFTSPNKAMEFVRRVFLKRFGEHLQTRAANMAKALVSKVWGVFCNFRGFGGLNVLTRCHILKAIQVVPESSAFLKVLEEVRTNVYTAKDAKKPKWDGFYAEEAKWDQERVGKCAEMLQLAMDQASFLLPSGFMLQMVEWAIYKASIYRRKMSFVRVRLAQTIERRKAEEALAALSPRSLPPPPSAEQRSPVASPVSSPKTKTRPRGKNKLVDNSTHGELGEIKEMVAKLPGYGSLDSLDHTLTPGNCLDLNFNGETLEELDLDCNAGVCKIYLEVLNKLYKLSAAVQSLKNSWHNKALKRAVLAAKTKQFLEEKTRLYKQDLQTDKVTEVWKKFQRVELAAHKTAIITRAIQQRREETEYVLSYIPRFGWEFYEDEYGYQYWYDNRESYGVKLKHGPEESTYEMPVYTYQEWEKVVMIQKRVSRYVCALLEKRRVREEQRRLDLIEAEKRQAEEERLGARVVNVKMLLRERVLNAVGRRKREKSPVPAVKRPTTGEVRAKAEFHTPSLEEMLPWRARFETETPFVTGDWAILTGFPRGGVGTGNSSKALVTRTDSMRDIFDSLDYTGGSHLPVAGLAFVSIATTVTGSAVVTTPARQTKPAKGPKSATEGEMYRVVMVYGVRAGEGLCNVRTVKGNRIKDVKMNRLCHLRLDVGMQVETRYRSYKVFYRSVITKADYYSGPRPRFDVVYEDGEVAKSLEFDVIRPSLTTLQHYIAAREWELAKARQQHRRMLHFSKLRGLREEEENKLRLDQQATEDSATEQTQVFKAKSPKGPAFPVKPTEEEDDDEFSFDGSVLSSLASPHDDTDAKEEMSVNSTTSAGLASVVSVVPTITVEDQHVQIIFTKQPIRFGWSEYLSAPIKGQRRRKFYHHESTEELSQQRPVYTASENMAVKSIQAQWRIHIARRRLYKKVSSISLTAVMNTAVEKAKKIAHVGYELEGLTGMQMLRRAGCWDLAEALEGHVKVAGSNFLSLTVEEILSKTKEQFEQLGITHLTHLRDLRELQAWWKKTPLNERHQKLQCFNGFSDPADSRDIQTCLQESEEALVDKFMKVFKGSASRTRGACRTVLFDANARYPHAHQQVEYFLKRYHGKPELARESVFELMDKATTHTWVEERQALKVFSHFVRVAGAILSHRKLKRLRKEITDIEKQAAEIAKDVPSDKNRRLCPGPEGKAAWLLRRDAVAYLLRCEAAANRIQCRVRSHLCRKRFLEVLEKRIHGVLVIQRCSRRALAFRLASELHKQKESSWEQLWDGRRNRLYYYNVSDGKSQYEEPFHLDPKTGERKVTPYRPLVRDPLSLALMQAWPELDVAREGDESTVLMQKSEMYLPVGNWPMSTLCGVCEVRRAVRVCMECVDEVNPESDRSYNFPYCFPCFMRQHLVVEQVGTKSGDHQFYMLDPTASTDDSTVGADSADPAQTADPGKPLMCCVCGEAATRKCLGLLDQHQIDSICNDLRRAPVERWMGILRAANVAGERKLVMMMEEIQQANQQNSSHRDIGPSVPTVAESDENGEQRGSVLSVSQQQLQNVRQMLERARAECDESYCQRCYDDVHSAGRRALHRWQGFVENAPTCSVCVNSPAEMSCRECGCIYCSSCFRVFHSMGRKRKHKHTRILEEIGEDQKYCGICERRVATELCPNDCGTNSCDSCLLFHHKETCEQESLFSGRKRVALQKSSGPSLGAGGVPLCVLCGEEADQKCIQCGDYYCSRVWMGNPGCYAQLHARGNRASHTTERVVNAKNLARLKREKLRQGGGGNQQDSAALVK